MTVLYLSDWQKYKGAIIDTECSNKSFVRYSALLRQMGIKNHAFPLVLLNPELQGVDPFDPNLSIEQMMSIALECKQNFWYFIRAIAIVPGSGLDRQPLICNRGNIALFWLFLNHISMFLIQPRQTGKSFCTDVIMNYILNIASTDTYLANLTKDETLRSRALGRLKSLIEELPFYLNQKTRNDAANTEEITIKRLNNRYKAMLPSKSPKAALNVGRGLTAPVFHVDEIAFIYNIEITLPSALPATSAARKIADIKGEPYGNIFTTTAGKRDDKDGKFVYELVTNSAVWTEKFFDARDSDELEELIRLNSANGEFRVNCTFNHRQLGYTDKWLKEQLEITGSRGEDADRDYFNIWTSGSQTSPFPVEISGRIRDSEIPDAYIEITKPYNYIVRWYIPLETKDQRLSSSEYILSVDTSDAIGKDDIAIVLRDIRTGEVIAASNVNETNVIVYTKWLATWLINYSKITMIIERRSSGATIIDLLLLLLVEAGVNPFKRIYNKVVQERDEKPDRFMDVDKRYTYNSTELINKYKATFGFATSGSGLTSRSELYSTTLTNASKTTCDLVYDKKLIDQLLGLIIRNGRVDHEDGEHDDLCFIGSTLIRTINGNKPISELQIGDLVLTREGYKPIISIIYSERDVITKFGITGTPEHPFITPTGEIPFKDLLFTNIVYTYDEESSNIIEKSIIDILNFRKFDTESYLKDMRLILKKELVYNLTVAECHEYFVNDILVHNCISWLLSYWLMTQGKNLQYYGINTRNILINNEVSIATNNSGDEFEAMRQKSIQYEIQQLVETIQNEKNEYLIFKYETRLKKLASELNNDEAIHSVDALIESLRESKKMTRKFSNNFRYNSY
jgi:hypothetical protein